MTWFYSDRRAAALPEAAADRPTCRCARLSTRTTPMEAAPQMGLMTAGNPTRSAACRELSGERRGGWSGFCCRQAGRMYTYQ